MEISKELMKEYGKTFNTCLQVLKDDPNLHNYQEGTLAAYAAGLAAVVMTRQELDSKP